MRTKRERTKAGMNFRSRERIRQLELRVKSRERPEETPDERFRRGALAALSDAELESLREFVELREDSPNAEPTPTQLAAMEACHRHYEEFKRTGTLVVNGRPIE